MAAYPIFTVQDLSEFSGRPVEEYTNTAYAATASKQAILLFKLGTCLKSFPEDELMAELANNAIVAMADAIYLVQPFQKQLSNPFSSESIGSYSYSKLSKAVANGLPTGVAWFDMAVDQMGVCDLLDDIPAGGGIEMFEWDIPLTHGGREGNFRALSPQDLNEFRSYGYDPAPGL